MQQRLQEGSKTRMGGARINSLIQNNLQQNRDYHDLANATLTVI